MDTKDAEVIYRWVEAKRKLQKIRFVVPEWHNTTLEIQKEIDRHLTECDKLIDKVLADMDI